MSDMLFVILLALPLCQAAFKQLWETPPAYEPNSFGAVDLPPLGGDSYEQANVFEQGSIDPQMYTGYNQFSTSTGYQQPPDAYDASNYQSFQPELHGSVPYQSYELPPVDVQDSQQALTSYAYLGGNDYQSMLPYGGYDGSTLVHGDLPPVHYGIEGMHLAPVQTNVVGVGEGSGSGDGSSRRKGKGVQDRSQTGEPQTARVRGSQRVVIDDNRDVPSTARVKAPSSAEVDDVTTAIFFREWRTRGLSCDMEGEKLAAQVMEIKINHPGMEQKIGSMASLIVDRAKADDPTYLQTYHAWATTYRNKVNSMKGARSRRNFDSEQLRLDLLANFRNTQPTHHAPLADPVEEQRQIEICRLVGEDFMEKKIYPQLQMGHRLSTEMIADISLGYLHRDHTWDNTMKYIKKYLHLFMGWTDDQIKEITDRQKALIPPSHRKGRRSKKQMG